MKKIYILTAVLALLTLSLNAQDLKVDQNGNVVPPKAKTGQVEKEVIKPDGYFRMGPSRASTTPVTTFPYYNRFSSSDDFDWWETIDGNNDNATWYLSNQQACIQWNSSLALDDWLVTAPITLQAGKTYKFYIDAKNGGFLTERIEVKMASTNTAPALSSGTQIIAAQDVTNGTYNTLSNENVTVSTTGTYYFGIHAISIKDQYYLYVDNLVIDVVNTDPTIEVSDNTVNLMCKANETATETVQVTGMNLTGNITATLNDPNNVFSINTNSLSSTGGNLTVTYSPTASGSHTGTITLTNGTLTETITINGSCVEEKTICNGNETNYNLPIYGYYYDNFQKNQMIYPESELTALEGTVIHSMTFYAAQNFSFSGGSLIARLATTDQTSYSSKVRLEPSDIKIVASGFDVPSGGQTWTIVFSDGFEYNGGNLVVDMEEISHGSGSGSYADSFNFYGVTRTGGGFFSYGSTKEENFSTVYNGGTVQNFLPKVTFGYIDSTNPRVTVSPDQLTISDSGTNNTFNAQARNIVQGENLGVTPHNGFSTTCTSSTNNVDTWGFYQNNGSVDGTVEVAYTGRNLSASDDIAVGTLGASTTVHVDYVADLYIVTDNGVTGNWDFNNGTQMTNNDGIYTATFTAPVDNTYILFARKLGESNPWNTRYVFGPDSDGDWGWGANTGGNIDVNDDDPIVLPAGTYTVTIDATNYTFTITKLVPDLAISLDAPATIVGGNSATVTATVTNNGDLPATSYTVTISDGNTTLLNQTVNTELAVGTSATYTADYPTTAAQVGSTVNFAANVTCTGETNTSNNNATASMEVITMPAPENVVATVNSDQISATVTWDAPSNLPTGVGLVTEDFEDETVFPPFNTGGIDANQHYGEFGDWTLYDATGARVYGSKQVNYDNENEPHAWFVFKPSAATPDAQYPNATAHDAHNGSAQYLESICPLEDPNNQNGSPVAADHWLISPELSGNAQTITWWECELTTEYGDETYEVWVSDDDNDPSSFTMLGNDSYSINYTTWTQRSVQLPAGTKYFAIRHTSKDIFGMLIDDVTYEANNVTIEPVSYKIYLDGQYVATVPATTDPLSYDFGTLAAGTHVASVSAVYPNGVESAATPSNEFTIVAKTPTPTITYTETPAGVVITATGEGHVTLVVDGITYEGEGSVSATVVRSPEEREVTATATAQASGALPSDAAEEDITIPALTTDPTEMAEGLLRLHLLMVDQMIEDIPDDNSHPDRYNYVLRYEPNGPTGSGVKESSTVHVDIQKADCEVTGYYSLKQIDGDTIIGLDHKQGITMDVVTADVAYNLSSTNDLLYEYLLQGAKNRVPEYQQDYLTKLRQSQNFTYFEMLEGPDKGHEYPNGEHHYLGALELGTYGSTFMSYAPSVSTDGIQRRYYEDDGFDNTYGAPIWKTAVGEVKMSEEEAPIAERQTNQWNSVNWTDKDAQGNDAPASLFILDNIWATAKLPHTDIATVPYEPYMFRVFVQSNNGLLRPYKVVPQGEGQYDGEHLDAVDRDLTEADVKGPKCVWSGYLQFDEDGEVIGDLPNGVEVQLGTDDGGQKTFTYHKSKVDRQGGSNATLPQPSEWDKDPNNAMFGALDALAISGYDAQGKPILRNDITEDDLKIFVRFYYVVKGMADGWTPGTRGQGDDPAGYGSESGSSSPGIATSVNEIRYHGEAVETIYYNVQGMSSDRPFEGVNIVVTRYSDGATVVSKVVK